MKAWKSSPRNSAGRLEVVKMGRWLIFSENDNVAFELIARARAMNTSPMSLVTGDNARDRSAAYVAQGCDIVYISALPPNAALLHLANQDKPQTILIGSTRRGKELAGRLAQKLNAGCITDAIDIRVENNELVADRFSFGGATIATEKVLTQPNIIAVLPYTYPPNPPNPAQKGEVVELPLAGPTRPELKVLDRKKKEIEAVRLEEADVIVGVGKGVKKQEDLSHIARFAAMLKGELGCTRALAMDYKWLSEDRVIGLSGKKTAPKLYVAIGISGQIQHTVGIMRAKTIVAINRDSEAPIFKIADYGLVGDWYKLVPRLTELLK